jgi:hypothetical protein
MNTTAEQATNKLGLPVTECTRCGARGEMGEYAHVDAGRCFKCGGTGMQLTPAGARAMKAYLEHLDNGAKKPAGELKVGDRIKIRVHFGTITGLRTTENKPFKTTDGKEWPASTTVHFEFANSRCNFSCRSDMELTTDDGVKATDFLK